MGLADPAPDLYLDLLAPVQGELGTGCLEAGLPGSAPDLSGAARVPGG